MNLTGLGSFTVTKKYETCVPTSLSVPARDTWPCFCFCLSKSDSAEIFYVPPGIAAASATEICRKSCSFANNTSFTAQGRQRLPARPSTGTLLRKKVSSTQYYRSFQITWAPHEKCPRFCSLPQGCARACFYMLAMPPISQGATTVSIPWLQATYAPDRDHFVMHIRSTFCMATYAYESAWSSCKEVRPSDIISLACSGGNIICRITGFEAPIRTWPGNTFTCYLFVPCLPCLLMIYIMYMHTRCVV
jgi:hypothetical protein